MNFKRRYWGDDALRQLLLVISSITAGLLMLSSAHGQILTCGQVTNGTLAVGQTNVYFTVADAGDVIRVTTSATNFCADVNVYTETGDAVGSLNCEEAYFTLLLPVAGMYRIE